MVSNILLFLLYYLIAHLRSISPGERAIVDCNVTSVIEFIDSNIEQDNALIAFSSSTRTI